MDILIDLDQMVFYLSNLIFLFLLIHSKSRGILNILHLQKLMSPCHTYCSFDSSNKEKFANPWKILCICRQREIIIYLLATLSFRQITLNIQQMRMKSFKSEKIVPYSNICNMMWQLIALGKYYLASSIAPKDIITSAQEVFQVAQFILTRKIKQD